MLALAPAIARADVEGVVRYGVTPTDLQEDFFDGYGLTRNRRLLTLDEAAVKAAARRYQKQVVESLRGVAQ